MHHYHVVDIAGKNNPDLYDLSRDLWQDSLTLVRDITEGRRTKKVFVWDRRIGPAQKLTKVDLGFAQVDSEWATLASPTFWCAPTPTFARLTCLWQFKDLVDTHTRDQVAKVDDEFADAVKWTFWLNYQGIRHLDYLVVL